MFVEKGTDIDEARSGPLHCCLTVPCIPVEKMGRSFVPPALA